MVSCFSRSLWRSRWEVGGGGAGVVLLGGGG